MTLEELRNRVASELECLPEERYRTEYAHGTYKAYSRVLWWLDQVIRSQGAKQERVLDFRSKGSGV